MSLSFPLIILALAIVTILGSALPDVIRAITVPMVPRSALVIRSSALSIREMPYVDAARAAGFGHWRIARRHMLPKLMAPHLFRLMVFLGQAVLLEASLSFLGLGVQEPKAAWGLMEASCRRVRGDGAVDGDLPGADDQPRRLRVHSFQRFAARRSPSSRKPAGGASQECGYDSGRGGVVPRLDPGGERRERKHRPPCPLGPWAYSVSNQQLSDHQRQLFCRKKMGSNCGVVRPDDSPVKTP